MIRIIKREKAGAARAVLLLILWLASLFVHWQNSGALVLIWQRTPLLRFRHEIGFAFQSRLGTSRMSAHEKRSPARILENGIPLGPGNADHDEIRRLGRGRFSFWYDTVLFSASDNGDPTTNQKKYEILWPAPVPAGLRITLHIITLAFTFWMAARTARRVRISPWREGFPKAVILNGKALWRSKDPRVRGPGYLILAVLLGLSAFILYALSFDPVRTLGNTEIVLLYGTAHLFLGVQGFLGAKALSKKPRKIGRLLIRALASLLLACFFVFRVGLEESIPALLARIKFLLAAVAVGAAVFLLFRNSVRGPAPAPRTSPAKIRVVIALVALIALPGILKPVIQYWDISGYMDSRRYDNNAHDIVTGKQPQGNSFVMPLYQYGLASVYYVFGHFFFIQQIVNVLMALAAISLLMLTAWNIFRDIGAVLLAGVLAAFTTQLHHFVYITQVENWYIPLICLTIYLWSCYWRMPNWRHTILLGLASGLAYNCRVQGLFYFAFLWISPFFIRKLRWKIRVGHIAVAVLAFGLTLIPWSVRNLVYMKKFTPSSDQSRLALLLNDHRLPFYGFQPYLKNAFNWEMLTEEYRRKYPNEADRNKAIKRDFIKNTFGNPIWLAKAVSWRVLGFYGLIPPGVWDPEGPKPTDWKAAWKGYVFWGFYSIFFIAIAAFGLLSRPRRSSLFLLFCIFAQAALVIVGPMREPRYGYPALPLHLILGLFVFFKPIPSQTAAEWPSSGRFLGPDKRFRLLVGILCLTAFAVLCHITIGRKYLYRPIMEKAALVVQDTTIDSRLPSVNAYYLWRNAKAGPVPAFKAGEKIRLTCRLSNDMLPPKSAGAVSYLPAFATDPRRETYFYAYPLESGIVGMTFFGAEFNTVLREDDIVEIEGTILLDVKNDTLAGLDYWVKAEKAVLVRKAGTSPD